MSLLSLSNMAFSQYCTPPGFLTGPYTGFTRVKLGNLEHVSTKTQGYIYFSSVAAPLLGRGQSYTMEIFTFHDIKNSGFSDKLNVRVWIDWNQDFSFDDADEVVVNKNMIEPGLLSVTITVPAHAKPGTTRMRVYNDMPEVDGHLAPQPCGYPSTDLLGQHGQCKDYDVTVSSAGVGIPSLSLENLNIYPNPAGNSLQLGRELSGWLHIYSSSGRLEKSILLEQESSISLDNLANGLYYLRAEGNNKQTYKATFSIVH